MAKQKFFLHPDEFGRALVPKWIRRHLRGYLIKAGYYDVPYNTFGIMFYVSVVLTAFLLITFFFPFIEDYNPIGQMMLIFVFWVIIQLSLVILMMSVMYIYYDTKITKRTRDMEAIIEDFLRYVSENLKGGMSFDKALWAAIRPRYKTLGEEIRLVAKKVMTGQDIDDALTEFSQKYDSPTIRRSFQLIVEGLKGGGKITYIIDRTEENIRETKELKREIVTTNTTYIIFLSFIVTTIAPVLFALSYNLVKILKSISSKLQFTGAAKGSFEFDMSALANNPHLESLFGDFSLGAILVISTFSAMIVSIIKNGNIKEGLKYIPLFILISLGVYYLFRNLLGTFFGGIMV